MKIPTIRLYFTLVIISLLISACKVVTESKVEILPSVQSSIFETQQIPKKADGNTLVPSQLKISTTPISTSASLIPSKSLTPKPTRTPTWTHIPGLPPTEALDRLLTLYQDNGGCEVPCWWGITPGETTWQEAREILMPLGWVSEPFGNSLIQRYEFEFVVPETVLPYGYMWPTLTVENGIVTVINLSTQYIKPDFDFSLSGLLQKFNEPEEIWLKLYPESMSGPHYSISLFYPAIGVEFSATGNAQVINDIFAICPREFVKGSFPPSILFWQPRENVTFKNIGSSLVADSNWDENRENYSLLQDLTNEFSNSCYALE